MSLRWRLIGGIVVVLSALWVLTSIWYFFDVRAELRQVLDARLASSAHMVQGLLNGENLHLPQPPEVLLESPHTGSSKPPTDVICQLWTLEGRFIGTTTDGPLLPIDAIPDGISNQVVNGERWRVFALTDTAKGVRILTADQRDARRSLIMTLALKLAAPLALVLPAMLLLVFAAVRRGLIPLERLRRSVQARSADALDPIPAEGVPQELSPMVDALNNLFGRLSSAFERERRFTGDAAHELRTPLAGIKTQLQIGRTADGQVRERALAQAEAGVDRMSRLVTQMLTLARLESQAPGAQDYEPAQIEEVLTGVAQEVRSLAEQYRVVVSRHGPALSSVAPLPPLMLHTALRNLVENAIRHGAAGGRVELRSVRLSGSNRIDIMDFGPGLPEAELKQVSARFYRAKATEAAGTGLGLSIVAAIAQRYGLGFSLANRTEGAGLVASLELPDSPN